MNRPPMHCTPCRVTYEGVRFEISKDGTVRSTSLHQAADGSTTREYAPVWDSIAVLVRREASRQRRNRAARERHAAYLSVGMVKTPYGYE